MIDKKEIKLKINSTLNILSKIKLPTDFNIQFHKDFVFKFDGFEDNVDFDEAIITLTYKGIPQDVIKFEVFNKNIDVQYIQRVGTDLIRTKENRNLLLEALIFSSVPLLKKGCSFTCEKIPFLKERYESSINHPEKKSGYSRAHLKQELDIYTPIRDRYFTKEGVLNLKKERVLSILNNYNEARRKRIIDFPRISKPKERKPIKKIRSRPKSKIL